MGQNGAYILKGYGQIDPEWARAFLGLFKTRQVNIRRLVFLQTDLSKKDAMLEIHFFPPGGEECSAFLALLEDHLLLQNWRHRTLESLSEKSS
ncbi:MAG TPA: hypothetical protein V6C99_04465 [Oculatellaceae cyanobacterium]|jgi:hypothetical protein